MDRLVKAVITAVFLFVGSAAADAAIVVTVDKTAQRLTVNVDGVTRYQWPVSTARWGYRTPNGNYRPQRLERQWYSRKYDWSPMPHSIFFAGGYAIHGSYEVSRLGRPASHGCIRLHPHNAAILFDLVRHNVKNTSIVVVGGASEPMARLRARQPAERVVRNHPHGRVAYDERPATRRRAAQSFEEIFDVPPRDSRRRAARWDDYR